MSRIKESKKTNEWWRRKKSVPLAKKIAVKRDGRCVRCKRKQPYKLEGSHIKPESHYHNLSDDLDNIICLCSWCHQLAPDSWHSSPKDQDWFDEKYPFRMELLRSKDKLLSLGKVDHKAKYYELLEVEKKLEEIA